MNRRELLICLGTAAGLAGCAGRAPRWATETPARYGPPSTLPPPVTDGRVSLERVIAARRSERRFRPDPLPPATVGQLFWAGQGITRPDGRRAAPSAGALYPIELYAVTTSVVMRYLPDGHRIETRTVADLRPALRAAAFGQRHVAAAPLIVVVAAHAERTRAEYGAFAEAFVEREVGHVAQNILLTATALDLAAVPVGSVDGPRAAVALGLPPDQRVHYLIPTGRPAAGGA